MKKAIVIAFLIWVSTIFLSLPSSTHARLVFERKPVTAPITTKPKPAVNCPPGSIYTRCLPRPVPAPAPCSPYVRNCKK
ncbi:hypothetical protein QN277_001130 [Acacia crassicarpa]|uniref:Uncharacterized protein n=1 Tax=Acacia crassicarpa TaxID=499986 RepID=A0AAE1N7Z6_9FABA|nr:hypothetical protein QN277_001130 [Acacia crassicarpa]